MGKALIDKNYARWIAELKAKVRHAQLKAAASNNRALIELYWELGRGITEREKEFSYGENFIEKVAVDLKHEFPDIKGFSRRNLYAIRQWYLFFNETGGIEVVHRLGAQLPWRHQVLLVQKFKDLKIINLYARTVVRYGWSRDALEANIKDSYHLRIGNADHNFDVTLPKPQSDLAIETIKNPYYFDFLGLGAEAQERDIEKGLIKRITEFMLELGKGFAYVGRQYAIQISDSEYFIDLLFYHLHLRSFVVIEIKAGRFKPEYAGKLNFYLSAVDSQLKHATDNPSIGIILCRTKDKIEVEYALRDINKPIGVSSFELSSVISMEMRTQLPTVEEIETGLFAIAD
ncbi:MAG TPA: PDDEXK nuclease domain-containing protein [Puia sp.]|nr:PDDEXK nuclease domain-containing protein [Puia sp.]